MLGLKVACFEQMIPFTNNYVNGSCRLCNCSNSQNTLCSFSLSLNKFTVLNLKPADHAVTHQMLHCATLVQVHVFIITGNYYCILMFADCHWWIKLSEHVQGTNNPGTKTAGTKCL